MAASPQLPHAFVTLTRTGSPGARAAADGVTRRRQATRKARSGVPPNVLADAPWRRVAGGRYAR
jgi:hypothetical protein